MKRKARALHRPPAGVLLLGTLLLGALSCSHQKLDLHTPIRPYAGPGGRSFAIVPPPEPFPERALLRRRDEPPPRTLARLDQILRQIASLDRPEKNWESGDLGREMRAIERGLDSLRLGAGLLMRHRLKHSTDADRAALRASAAYYMRWGLAQMRTGEVNQRIWGAEKLRLATEYDPGDPIPVLVLSNYLELAGYWSAQLELLDKFTRENGHRDLVDLQQLRLRERAWTVTREPESLDQALALCAGLCSRQGGPAASPPWLNLERARLYYLADSSRAAAAAALLVLRGSGEKASAAMATVPAPDDPRPALADTASAAQAELLLGVLAVRRLEYDEAAERLERSLALAAACPDLAALASWMTVPWDLFSDVERSDFNGTDDQSAWLDHFWTDADPILATPRVREDRLEYMRRVGEAWFSLSGVDPSLPGPLSDPGRVMLRLGPPVRWTSNAGEGDPRAAASELFAINRSWRFFYQLPSPLGVRSVMIQFQDHGSSAHFVPVDTVGAALDFPYTFDTGFGGKSYYFNTWMARFREPEGRVRVVLTYDTYLPDYAVRFPLQGFYYDGEARVRSAIYRKGEKGWTVGPQAETVLDRETVVPGQWSFRRRAGVATFPRLEPGTARVASLLTLRDKRGNVTALAVDNGREGSIPAFRSKNLEASDLLLLSSLGDAMMQESERTLAPGVIAYGPDPANPSFQPRAGRLLLSGENLAFYLEVYNIGSGADSTEAELITSLERLRDDGSLDYAVGMSGRAQTLRRVHVNQWNIARSFNLEGMVSGNYRLIVEVRDRVRDQIVQRAVDFRVVDSQDLVNLYNWAGLEPPDR